MKILKLICFIFLLSSCIRQSNIENVSAEKEIKHSLDNSFLENNTTMHIINNEKKNISEPITEYILKDITEIILKDFNYFRTRNANDLNEYLALNNITQEYFVTNKQTIKGFHTANDLERLEILTDTLKLIVIVNEVENRFLTGSAEIDLKKIYAFISIFKY
ncbi:MAG: hypothetical protein LBU88_01215 [Treponema sp.]|jgi:hypothetical protein|nr:hypothetical protein [Treponema sp.]